MFQIRFTTTAAVVTVVVIIALVVGPVIQSTAQVANNSLIFMMLLFSFDMFDGAMKFFACKFEVMIIVVIRIGEFKNFLEREREREIRYEMMKLGAIISCSIWQEFFLPII